MRACGFCQARTASLLGPLLRGGCPDRGAVATREPLPDALGKANDEMGTSGGGADVGDRGGGYVGGAGVGASHVTAQFARQAGGAPPLQTPAPNSFAFSPTPSERSERYL